MSFSVGSTFSFSNDDHNTGKVPAPISVEKVDSLTDAAPKKSTVDPRRGSLHGILKSPRGKVLALASVEKVDSLTDATPRKLTVDPWKNNDKSRKKAANEGKKGDADKAKHYSKNKSNTPALAEPSARPTKKAKMSNMAVSKQQFMADMANDSVSLCSNTFFITTAMTTLVSVTI